MSDDAMFRLVNTPDNMVLIEVATQRGWYYVGEPFKYPTEQTAIKDIKRNGAFWKSHYSKLANALGTVSEHLTVDGDIL